MNNSIKSISNIYKKMSNFGKLLLFVTLFLILVIFFNSMKIPTNREGYQQNDMFLFKSGYDIYDKFYVDVYDQLVFNNIKDDYEIGEIINKTKSCTNKS